MIITGISPTYIQYPCNQPNELDRGEKKDSLIQFDKEDVKNVSTVIDKFTSENREHIQEKYNSRFHWINDGIVFQKPISNNFGGAEYDTLGKIITQCSENPVVDRVVNQKIKELNKLNKLQFYPLNPSASAINFAIDSKNNLVMHHTVDYNRYNECHPDGTIKNEYIAHEDDKPFVRVDFIIKFTPDGAVLTKNHDNILRVTFNDCGHDLNQIFDMRSLWDKICEYLTKLFPSFSHDHDIDSTAPELKKDAAATAELSRTNVNKLAHLTDNTRYQTLLKDIHTRNRDAIKEDVSCLDKYPKHITEPQEQKSVVQKTLYWLQCLFLGKVADGIPISGENK
ncbi:Viral A-type inclusion protein [Yersinia frederiksenii]|uniref:Viral A-type inclusion protein n=2 Tax=Yersinia alsatica TaxID=2890317 RepID=A0ABY5UPY7_9GAMM|nr:hypothetical protein [Yersinia alsatica]CNH88119.1 Viral A-type inclusion protein [Yersinia frederiksenii]UWM43938.1 hypothetical protein N0H69_14575 [Yersinia alsatica]CNK45985.1 Viral A-type inclusion protein [Yersinia frederiksenii]CNK80393.1 Viral A-type inclusion protein [Yersinia frederiksenii]CNK81613.1 Viral A-type inclusion protein [Yersinia frederiksenii]